MKLLIVTGGTGGHIYPAIALADCAKKRWSDVEILFIGNDNRMEAKEIPAHGYAFSPLHTSGFTGSVVQKGKAVMQMFIAKAKAKKIIKQFQPDVVIGFGGYVSAPVIMAAHALSIPTMIHEQNSIVGVANKLVRKQADAIVTCYDKCKEVFTGNQVRQLGNPRASMVSEVAFNQAYFESLGLSMNKRTVLIMMGSLGSTSINEMMKEALKEIPEGVQVLYVTGKNNYEEMKGCFHHEDIHVVDYVITLEILDHVDIMICRAGATTIAELSAKGIASILIPSPYVAHNHQYFNAMQLVENKAALMIEEKDLNEKTLKAKLHQILDNPLKQESIAAQAKKMGTPFAANDMLDWIEQLKR